MKNLYFMGFFAMLIGWLVVGWLVAVPYQAPPDGWCPSGDCGLHDPRPMIGLVAFLLSGAYGFMILEQVRLRKKKEASV